MTDVNRAGWKEDHGIGSYTNTLHTIVVLELSSYREQDHGKPTIFIVCLSLDSLGQDYFPRLRSRFHVMIFPSDEVARCTVYMYESTDMNQLHTRGAIATHNQGYACMLARINFNVSLFGVCFELEIVPVKSSNIKQLDGQMSKIHGELLINKNLISMTSLIRLGSTHRIMNHDIDAASNRRHSSHTNDLTPLTHKGLYCSSLVSTSSTFCTSHVNNDTEGPGFSTDGMITTRDDNNNVTTTTSARHHSRGISIVEIEFRSKHGEPYLKLEAKTSTISRTKSSGCSPTNRCSNNELDIGMHASTYQHNGNDNNSRTKLMIAIAIAEGTINIDTHIIVNNNNASNNNCTDIGICPSANEHDGLNSCVDLMINGDDTTEHIANSATYINMLGIIQKLDDTVDKFIVDLELEHKKELFGTIGHIGLIFISGLILVIGDMSLCDNWDNSIMIAYTTKNDRCSSGYDIAIVNDYVLLKRLICELIDGAYKNGIAYELIEIHEPSGLSTGSTYHYGIFDMHSVIICTIRATGCNGHDVRCISYNQPGAKAYFDDRVIISTNSTGSVIVDTIGYNKNTNSPISAIGSFVITMIGSTTQHDVKHTMQHLVIDNSYVPDNNASAHVLNAMIGNNNDTCTQLLDNHISDIITSNYMSLSRVGTNCINTNTHVGVRHEMLNYIVGHECGETSDSHADTYAFNYNGQSLRMGIIIDNPMHDNEMNKMRHFVHNNLSSSTMDTNDDDFGNDDSFSMPQTDARISDITSDHESMPRCTLDCCNTDDTHTGTGSESLACAVTYDETQMYITCNSEMNTLWMCASNGCTNCVMIRECDRSSNNCGIVMIQFNTIIQSSRMDHEVGFPFDIPIQGNEMKICYSIDKLCLKGIRVGTKKTCFDLHIGTRISTSWMTKANRRGVTCTRKVRICLVSCLYPYLLGSPLFERELESRII